jgi:hypothetical protein
MTQGFVKLNRGEGIELLEVDPKAFLLLTKIALRARRKDAGHLITPLKANQAFIGDHEKIGLTRAQYRGAQKRLARYGFATFVSCNKGTIATLTSTAVYDINAEQEISFSQPSDSPMEMTKGQPEESQPITITESAITQQEPGEKPLTRKEEARREESKKATTAPELVDGFYECLRRHQSLSEEEKKSLMAYPEDRVIKALEWAGQTEIKTTLIQALHWHCKQPEPPRVSEKAMSGQTPQQRAAWEYNRFLEEEGLSDLARENQKKIPLGHISIVEGSGIGSISLNNPIDVVQSDFIASREAIRKNKINEGRY